MGICQRPRGTDYYGACVLYHYAPVNVCFPVLCFFYTFSFHSFFSGFSPYFSYGIFSEKEQEKRSEEVLKERIKPEEMPAKDIKKPGKFGADNFNTTRSGRVFTEEELEKQIRD